MANPRRLTARVGARGASPNKAPVLAPGIRSAEPTLRQKLQYRFDNTMSRGTPALVGWLALVTLALVAGFTVVVLMFQLGPEGENGERDGVISQAFKTFLHALDPGTVAGDTGSWQFLLTMFLITIGG